MELFNPKSLNFKFTNLFKIYSSISVLFVIASIVMFFLPGLNYGIDFKGGVEAHVRFDSKNVSSEELRVLLSEKTKNLSIVEIDKTETSEYFIRIQEDDTEVFSKILSSSLGEKYGSSVQILKLDSVGPQIGAELRTSALLSILYTCLLVALYMYWRFDMRFAPGALLSTFHDIIATFGFLAISQIEFSTATVAALLTITGYSINDTVVVYDRIRELEKKLLGTDRKSLLNLALNTTLSRTFITGGTTIISCIVLYFVGGDSLKGFSATLLFGVFCGTYSSLFVAAPCYLLSDRWVKNQDLKTRSA